MTDKVGNDDYLLNRNRVESARLDSQHEMIIGAISGVGRSPIHAKIPEESLISIADIGTGTGRWLRDTKAYLDKKDSSSSRYYHGFDISAAQFPSETDIDFSEHDIRQPFPDEHLSRYDLVHIRLLFLALKVEEYAKCASNLKALLKPGGFLQWVEYDGGTYIQRKDEDYPAFQELNRLCVGHMAITGKATDAPVTVKAACSSAGFINIQRYDYKTLENPELYDLSRTWAHGIAAAMAPGALRALHPELDQAVVEERSSTLLTQIQRDFADGVVASPGISVVIAQKPGSSV